MWLGYVFDHHDLLSSLRQFLDVPVKVIVAEASIEDVVAVA